MKKRWKRVKLATHCGPCHAIEVYPRLARIGAKTQLVRSTESTPQAFVPKRSARFFPWARCRMLNWPYNFWWPYPLRTVGRVLGDTRHFAVEAIGGYPAAREMSNSNDFPGGTQSPVSAPHFFWSSVISPPAGFTNFTETSVGSSSTRVTSRLDLGDIQTFWSTQIAVVYEFL